MAKRKNKWNIRLWSLALCLCMIVSCLPVSAFAEEGDEDTHVHTDGCCEEITGITETTETTEVTETTEPAEVTESKEAAEPAESTEDTTVSAVDAVRAMIDALPEVSELETMNSDELDAVYMQAQEAYDGYEALAEDEQAELSAEVEKLATLLDYMASFTMTVVTEAQKLTLPSSAGNGRRLSTFTYSDGVTQYFTFNGYLYKITYTNLSSSSFSFAIYNSSGTYFLALFKGNSYSNLKSSSSSSYDNYLRTSALPTTGGGILTGYEANYSADASKPSITITCLALNENPTWNWSSDYSSASVVFTAKNEDVQATVNASMATKIITSATNCTEKDTVEYTASVSFGGSTYTDTRTAANGDIGSHAFIYSASGNVITESCSNGCEHKQTATLNVDTSTSLLYTGLEIKPLKVEYSADWRGGELSISYAGDCVSLGAHSGIISKDGVTATQSFEIITPTLVTNDNYASLKLDSSYVGYYAISSAAELRSFAALINNDVSEQKNAVLLNNIDLNNIAWTTIGNECDKYTGTFDGNGMTISNFSLTATSSYQGLFGVVSGGTVKNVTVKGNINITQKVNNVGGIVGYAQAGATIEDVTSYVTINDTRTGIDTTNGDNRATHIGGVAGNIESSTLKDAAYEGTINLQVASSVGGVVGIASNNAAITYCVNNGSVTSNGNSAHVAGVAGDAQTGTYITYCINYGNVTTTAADCVGGVVAYSNQNAKIEYCGNVGTVTYNGDSTGTPFIGGVLGYINNAGFKGIANCYNYGKIVNSGVTTYTGAIIGRNRNSTVSTFTNNYYLSDGTPAYGGNAISNVYAMTAEQFKSGKVAYLLNGSTNAGTWKQTVNSDNYPSLSGKDVYGGYICGSGNSDMVYRNSMDGLITFASPDHDYNDAGTCKNCGASKAAVWNVNDNLYEIYNEGHLQWFAEYVNAGNTSINGKLMADIDASSLTSLAIGVSGKAYSGTFDGNGHTLTVGLNSTAQYAAPFQYVNGATIKNLIMKGSITTNQKFAASIVGQSTGTTTIENCLSYVTINSSVSGDGTHGGLVANVSSGTTTINNCGFVGAINGSNTDSCGGLVGWSNGTTKISNSFVAATFSVNANNGNTFSRGNNITVTNCYYRNALGDVPSGATQKNTDQFASGEVAWLLNGSNNDGTWKQGIGTDDYPNFSGSAVYKTAPCEIYSNAGATKEHDVEYGVCKSCNAVFQTIVPAIWNETKQAYEIYAASQLMWFAGLVNGTLDGVEQNQFANAILMNDIDMWSVTDYVPIGGTTGLYYSSEGNDKGYQGVFDGNGHVIKNLSVTGSDTDERTYGVFGTLSGMVKHLGVENFTFTLGSQDCRVGGIAGQMLSGGLIEDCYVANSTITATGKVAGGIAGCNYAGTIKNCFTYKVTVTATRTGGIVGDNCGDNSSDRKGSVINCYTDASAIENSSRKGNVSSSTASMSASDFASGLVGYFLDYNRDLWKQTIGSQDYPTFNGATIKVDGYNIAGSVISAKITWTAMEFTYTYSAGTWNPDTHSYSGASGVWSVVDGGGAITVENKGEQDFYSAFGFTSYISGITGEFDIKSQFLKSGTSVTSKLTLSGMTTETGFSNLPLGSAKVVLTKNQPAAVWNVGDKVTYIADDGETYTCVVISKSNGVCTLITDNYVLDSGVSRAERVEKLQSTGGRLPNGSNSAEMDALRARCENTYGGNYIDGSSWKKVYYLNGEWKYNDSFLKARLYIVFDVPSL